MSTCNWLDLETLGSRPLMFKILSEHCLLQREGRACSLIWGSINVKEVKVSLVKDMLHRLVVNGYVFLTLKIGGGENIDSYV